MKKNKKFGFTLIELLIVIAIIGLLSTLAVAALGPARKKARDAKRISDVKAIQKALEMAKDANGGIVTATNLASYIQGGIPVGTTNNPYYICLDASTGINKYLVHAKLESSSQSGNIVSNPDWTAIPFFRCGKITSNVTAPTFISRLPNGDSCVPGNPSYGYCVGDGD